MVRQLVRRAGLTLLVAACSEHVAAPGVCPQFCPAGALTVVDTVFLTAISGDSAYGRPSGYADPDKSAYLIASNLAGVRQSRPIFRTSAIAPRVPIGTDTTTGPVVGVDSLRLALTITRREPGTRNLSLSLYRLPLTIDSTSTLAGLAASFGAAPVRTVNVDSLIARPGRRDPVTKDSVVVDTVNQRTTLILHLDSAQTPYVPADTGKLAFGIRVNADTLATVTIGSVENVGFGPVVSWYLKVDSLGAKVLHPAPQRRSSGFDSFVFDVPSPALDSTLVVGGVPATRSVLRVAFPRILRDSTRIIRATLELLPAVLPTGIAADSFGVVAHAVVGDFGAKSPLDFTHVDTARVRIGPLDTLRIEVADILRYWAADSSRPAVFVLRQVPEGGNFAEIRLFASRTAASRPRLHVTYAHAFSFAQP